MGLKAYQLRDLLQGPPLNPQLHDPSVRFRQAVQESLRVSLSDCGILKLGVVIMQMIRQTLQGYVRRVLRAPVIPLSPEVQQPPVELLLLVKVLLTGEFPGDPQHLSPIIRVQHIRRCRRHHGVSFLKGDDRYLLKAVRSEEQLTIGGEYTCLLHPPDPQGCLMGNAPLRRPAGVVFHPAAHSHGRPSQVRHAVAYMLQEQVAFNNLPVLLVQKQLMGPPGQVTNRRLHVHEDLCGHAIESGKGLAVRNRM